MKIRKADEPCCNYGLNEEHRIRILAAVIFNMVLDYLYLHFSKKKVCNFSAIFGSRTQPKVKMKSDRPKDEDFILFSPFILHSCPGSVTQMYFTYSSDEIEWSYF